MFVILSWWLGGLFVFRWVCIDCDWFGHTCDLVLSLIVMVPIHFGFLFLLLVELGLHLVIVLDSYVIVNCLLAGVL